MSNTTTNYWSLHTHSRYSVKDALSPVDQMVKRAVELGYPALGLTDHGSVSGVIQLYTACRKAEIEPLPGVELYVVPDIAYAKRGDEMHLTVNAYNETGYRNLMKMATLTNRRFYFKPRIDFADFARMSDAGELSGLSCSTGCYFGILAQVMMGRGPAAAADVLKTLAGWFPKGRVYVELQNHGIGQQKQEGAKFFDFTEDELNDALFDVAAQVGLPVVVTRDSHYIYAHEQRLHDALKRLISYDGDDSAIFPGGGYFMTNAAGLAQYFSPKHLAAGLEGLEDLYKAAHLRLPELENFTLRIPDVAIGKDPQKVLEAKVRSILRSTSFSDDEVYGQAVTKELAVIATSEMAPYILLVDKVCQFMVDQDISFHARGSASGSMVCYLLGITQVDPIRFKLRFDRFLSTNRLKPPDVDLDVEHTRRDEVVSWLMGMWSVRSIGSLMTYSLFPDEEGDENTGRGSLKVQYYSSLKKRGEPRPDKFGDISQNDRHILYQLASLDLISGYGTHAAGYLIATDERAVAQLPMAWIPSSKKMVTAYGQKDVERLGFLKLDLLGLKTCTAIKSMELMTGLSFNDIPEGDKETMTMIAAGKTTGVFELQGAAAKYGCKDLKPTNIEDIIAIQALFRPAAMHSGATKDYLARRQGKKEVPVRHDDISAATSDTYGVLLYQEQVMDVMNSLGMTSAELQEMLDAVKASNKYSAGAAAAIEKLSPRISSLALGRDWAQGDIDWLKASLISYADYAFNRAHATSYGVVSYRTAYMRRHYPIQFWCAMLQSYANSSKRKDAKGKTIPSEETVFITEARRDKVDILPPHVNYAKASYTLDKNGKGEPAIRRGFLCIKGVGLAAAKELMDKAPYSSLSDMGERLLPRKVGGAKPLALGKSPMECGAIIKALDEWNAMEGLS